MSAGTKKKSGGALVAGLALVLVAVVLAVAGAAFPAGARESWQWQAQTGPLVSTASGVDEITLSVQLAADESPLLVVAANGRVLQEAGSSSLDGDQAVVAFSVSDSSGTRAVTGVARSDVAHLYLAGDGGDTQELALSPVGAFATGDVPTGASVSLEAVAADGSAIERTTLPQTSAACVGVTTCTANSSTTASVSTLSSEATAPAYAITESHSKGLVHDSLTRIDPSTLNPVGRTLLLGSGKAAQVVGPVALSPDQKRIAFAGNHGGTIAIVDLASMRITKRIPTRNGISIRSLAWLDNDQLALIAQRMSAPYNRNVAGRWLIRVHVTRATSVALSVTKKAAIEYSQRAGSRLITVLRPNDFRDPARTIIVSDADGRTFLFPITLPAPSPKVAEDRPIASADGKQIYIPRGGGQVIDIDIDAQNFSVHQIVAPADAPATRPTGSVLLADATAHGLVVSGFFTFDRQGGVAYRSGVYRIDTTTWTATTLDPDNRDFLVYGDKIATFNLATPPLAQGKNRAAGRGAGVSVFSASSGQRLYHLYGTHVFSGVIMIGRTGHALRRQIRPGVLFPYAFLDSRFNLTSGAARGQSRPPLASLRLIYRGSQAIGESGAQALASTRSAQSTGATATATTTGTPAAELPRAFARPATHLDALPAKAPLRGGIRGANGRVEKILATRRIASYTDVRGRRALLYLVRTPKQMCEFTLWRGGAGGGCNTTVNFFAGRHVVAGSGHLISGVADDAVATLVVVGTHGGRHRVTPTPDGGFIYDCKAYSGCTGCVIDRVEAFNSAGQKIEEDRVTGRCTRRR